MGIDAVGGAHFSTISTLEAALASGDMEAVLIAFSIERADFADGTVRDKIATMREKNEKIAELSKIRELIPQGGGSEQVEVTGERAQQLAKAIEEQGLTVPEGMEVHPEGDKAAAAELQSVLDLINGRQGLGGYHGDIWWRADDIINVAQKYGIDLGDIDIKTWETGQKYVGPTGGNLEAKWVALETRLQAKIDQVSQPHVKASGDQYKALMGSLDNKISAMKSNEQLEMVELQRLVSLQNNAFEMASNLSKKFENTKSGIIRNMG